MQNHVNLAWLLTLFKQLVWYVSLWSLSTVSESFFFHLRYCCELALPFLFLSWPWIFQPPFFFYLEMTRIWVRLTSDMSVYSLINFGSIPVSGNSLQKFFPQYVPRYSKDVLVLQWGNFFYHRQQKDYVYIVVNVVISYMVPPAARPTFNK